MTESETERGSVIEKERRYYLCPSKLNAETFARVVRGHWGIENGLHRVLDVVFRDDLARLRSGHEPANMAIVKHAAMNLLTQAKPTTSLKNRRKRAGWNQHYLEKIIRRTTRDVQAMALDGGEGAFAPLPKAVCDLNAAVQASAAQRTAWLRRQALDVEGRHEGRAPWKRPGSWRAAQELAWIAGSGPWP